MPHLFNPPEAEEALSRLLHDCACVFGPFEVFNDLYTEEIEAVYVLQCRSVNVEGGVHAPPLFPVVHNQLLLLADVEEEVVALATHCQVTDHLPVG